MGVFRSESESNSRSSLSKEDIHPRLLKHSSAINPTATNPCLKIQLNNPSPATFQGNVSPFVDLSDAPEGSHK